jgi:hypothetical protein
MLQRDVRRDQRVQRAEVAQLLAMRGHALL